MANKAASIGRLQELHAKLTDAYIGILDECSENNIPVDAATLSSVAKFLKDNNVSADPADADDLKDLREKLKAQAEARKQTGQNILSLVENDEKLLEA